METKSRREFVVASPRCPRMPSYNSVAVIGAGAWGTALAGVAARAGREVVLCARDRRERAAEIAATRINPRLPGRAAGRGRRAVTGDIARRARADIILIATPAQHLREAVAALAPHLARATPVVASAKGIERGTHKFMTEVIAEAAPEARPAILSGPSFAEDVARGLPTAVTLAAKDERSRARWCRRWARRPSGPITPQMSAASKSAAPRRTCWRSRPASSPAEISARRR